MLTDYVTRLARVLQRRGITQYQLAKALGKSPAQVNRWLRGRSTPSLRSVEQIERALAHIATARRLAR